VTKNRQTGSGNLLASGLHSFGARPRTGQQQGAILSTVWGEGGACGSGALRLFRPGRSGGTITMCWCDHGVGIDLENPVL
jgi:hypothetical protein